MNEETTEVADSRRHAMNDPKTHPVAAPLADSAEDFPVLEAYVPTPVAAGPTHPWPPLPGAGQPVVAGPPRLLRVLAWINLAVGVLLPLVNYLVVHGSITKLRALGLSAAVTAPLWVTIWVYAGTGLLVLLAGVGLYRRALWGRLLSVLCGGWFFLALFVSVVCGHVTLALAMQEYRGPFLSIEVWYAAPMLTPLYGILLIVLLNLPGVRRWARGVRAVRRGVPPELAFAPAAEPPISALAVVSLVFSLIPCLLVTQAVGFVTGLLALRRIRLAQGALGGRGMALAGTIISSAILTVLGSLVALGITLALLQQNRPPRYGAPGRPEVQHIHYP
jgi:hypothetical protein